MSIMEAIHEAFDMLNHIEIKGEHNIAAMSRAMSNLKAVIDVFEQRETFNSLSMEGEEVHDCNDK